jgi:molecular chaperone IbpA
MYQISKSSAGRFAALADLLTTHEARLIGFDRHWRMLESFGELFDSRGGYPPFNMIRTGEDTFRLELAIAGFRRDQVKVTVVDSTLVIEGDRNAAATEGEEYLHRGIATRRFRQAFALFEHVEVVGAELLDGVLGIDLTRTIPEEKKPRVIDVK